MSAKLRATGYVWAVVATVCATMALWHHVRVQQFVQAFWRDLRKRLLPRLRSTKPELATSLMCLESAQAALTYQLRIRHKARLVELSAELRQLDADVALSKHLMEVKAQAGENVEIDVPTRSRARFVDVIPLNPDPTQPISRSLTDERAVAVAKRMARLISVVESLQIGEQTG